MSSLETLFWVPRTGPHRLIDASHWLPIPKHPQLLSPIPSLPHLSCQLIYLLIVCSAPHPHPHPHPTNQSDPQPLCTSQPSTAMGSLPWGSSLRIIPGHCFNGWSLACTLHHRAENLLGSSSNSPSARAFTVPTSLAPLTSQWGWGKWDTSWPRPSTHKGHILSSLGSQVKVPSSDLGWEAKHIPTSLA